jgi:hypothetical protein
MLTGFDTNVLEQTGPVRLLLIIFTRPISLSTSSDQAFQHIQKIHTCIFCLVPSPFYDKHLKQNKNAVSLSNVCFM